MTHNSPAVFRTRLSHHPIVIRILVVVATQTTHLSFEWSRNQKSNHFRFPVKLEVRWWWRQFFVYRPWYNLSREGWFIRSIYFHIFTLARHNIRKYFWVATIWKILRTYNKFSDFWEKKTIGYFPRKWIDELTLKKDTSGSQKLNPEVVALNNHKSVSLIHDSWFDMLITHLSQLSKICKVAVWYTISLIIYMYLVRWKELS